MDTKHVDCEPFGLVIDRQNFTFCIVTYVHGQFDLRTSLKPFFNITKISVQFLISMVSDAIDSYFHYL